MNDIQSFHSSGFKFQVSALSPNMEFTISDTIPTENITSIIHHIRSQKVILDRDLAELYGVETKVLKQAVRRNIKRFPVDFMFELSKQELANLRSQMLTEESTSKKKIRFTAKEKSVQYGEVEK